MTEADCQAADAADKVWRPCTHTTCNFMYGKLMVLHGRDEDGEAGTELEGYENGADFKCSHKTHGNGGATNANSRVDECVCMCAASQEELPTGNDSNANGEDEDHGIDSNYDDDGTA